MQETTLLVVALAVVTIAMMMMVMMVMTMMMPVAVLPTRRSCHCYQRWRRTIIAIMADYYRIPKVVLRGNNRRIATWVASSVG